ncbi:hypothetical protein H0H92_009072 [Tricholoma furcatifolium]|nr:hypothetical protein H0H92_009072 [Tricholoma furcatifolium]
MGFFDSFSDNHNDITNYDGGDHQAKFSHELIAGAAAYEAEKAYADHCAANGQPQSHQKAKEIVAGFAGAFADRMIETKGMDWVDRERVQRDGKHAPTFLISNLADNGFDHLVQNQFQDNNAYGDY